MRDSNVVLYSLHSAIQQASSVCHTAGHTWTHVKHTPLPSSASQSRAKRDFHGKVLSSYILEHSGRDQCFAAKASREVDGGGAACRGHSRRGLQPKALKPCVHVGQDRGDRPGDLARAGGAKAAFAAGESSE